MNTERDKFHTHDEGLYKYLHSDYLNIVRLQIDKEPDKSSNVRLYERNDQILSFKEQQGI